MDEENSIDELKKRTDQEDDSEDTLDHNSTNDGALNLLSPENDEETEVESKKENEKEPEVKSHKKEKRFKPNPYEEKFHSELSFISLVLGVFGLILPLFSVLAIIFGIGGLMQTHREHMKGKWMAIIGISLGFIGIIIIIVAIVFGIGFLEKYLLQFGTVDTLTGAAHSYIN